MAYKLQRLGKHSFNMHNVEILTINNMIPKEPDILQNLLIKG